MFETRIKICGITSPGDAELCLRHGADYLGLIFADSARRITPETAIAIRESAPGAMLVGVFADAAVSEVARIARECRLNIIQLHGRETPSYCETLQSLISLPVIKAVGRGRRVGSDHLGEYARTGYFLFDLDKNTAGEKASGRSPNGAVERLWTEAARARRKGFRIFLAGALSPSNVAEAVRRVEPYAVDVARGVEKSPGVKDPRLVMRFIREVRG